MRTIICLLLLTANAVASSLDGGAFNSARKGVIGGYYDEGGEPSFPPGTGGSGGGGAFIHSWFETQEPVQTQRVISSATGSMAHEDRFFTTSEVSYVTDISWVYKILLEYPQSETPVASVTGDSGVVNAPIASQPYTWVYQADGTTTIALISSTRTVNASVTTTHGTTSDLGRFLQFADNSVGKNMSNTIDSAIAGKSPSTTVPIYTTQNDNTQTYVRNVNHWTNGVADITCMAAWNSSDGIKKAGTLIAPDIVAFATHYQIPVGSAIRFVTNGNVVLNRTIVSVKQAYADITIARLDSALPDTITPAKVLPKTWNDKLKIPIYNALGVNNWPAAVCYKNQFNEFHVGQIGWLSEPSFTNVYLQFPTDAQRLIFNTAVILYDSGSPCFAIINNQLVLLTTWTSGGAGGGNFWGRPATYDAINAAITTLGSPYQLTPVDLSGFNSY